MDEVVKQALAKWPNVPHCYGWLGLDARGQWWMRDDRAQALGGFTSGVPGSRGAVLQHDKLIAFIHRNYASDEAGQWFFQNGPQRVYIELEATPLVWRVQDDYAIVAHIHQESGQTSRAQRCIVDEHGRVYIEADLGFGLIHSQDVYLAAQALEQGLWVAETVPTSELAKRFLYERNPQLARTQSA